MARVSFSISDFFVIVKVMNSHTQLLWGLNSEPLGSTLKAWANSTNTLIIFVSHVNIIIISAL